MAHLLKTLASAKISQKFSNASRVIARFRKTHYRRKNLAKIFYANRAIANFVPNFVGMATGFGRGKMPLAAFDGPSSKKLRVSAKISRKSLTKAEL